MSAKGIIMFLRMNNTRLERKILIILDFKNRFLPTYLPLCLTASNIWHLTFVQERFLYRFSTNELFLLNVFLILYSRFCFETCFVLVLANIVQHFINQVFTLFYDFPFIIYPIFKEALRKGTNANNF